MMLEQSLISPNFLGKESFRWFIGQVTQYVQTPIRPSAGGGYKAKVRIIGYHPDCDVIKDEELPWAHVLVPLNMGAGAGGAGVSCNAKGGEYVIGFFMDGDNGQQPVIIGALFNGSDIEPTKDFKNGTCGFTPFKPNKETLQNYNNARSDTGKYVQSGIPSTKGTVGVGSTSVSTVASRKTNLGGNETPKQIVRNVQKCKNGNSTFSQIVTEIKKFLYTVQQIQGLVSATTSFAASIPALVDELAQTLTDLFHEYTKYIRDEIIKAIYKGLSEYIGKLLPKDVKLFKQIVTDKVVDEITCAFYKIIQGLGEFFVNFLLQIVDTAIAIPLCAAESLVGSVLSSVSSQIEEAIGPALQEISNEIGNVVGPISGYVSQAISYVDKAVNFFTCESLECTPVYDYSMNVGWIPPDFIEDYNKVLNYPSKGIQSGKEAAKQWLGINNPTTSTELPPELQSQLGGCDVTSLECGLPNVTFFGGGGVEAAGLAVVDSLGQVAGINITDFGVEYTSPPYVSIEDPCNNGAGAQATAVINDSGSVTGVIINQPGYGYLNSSNILPGISVSNANPCNTNPIDASGSEVTGSIVGINIVRAGLGYTTGDLIIDSACPNGVELYPTVNSNGSITGVNIINPGVIRVFPQLTINSPNGEGAILQPIVKFKPVNPVTVETDKTKIKKVILCAENHDL